jgi:uncharacterized coiled-coil protein SlyX
MRIALALVALVAVLSPAAADETISWEEADKHLGEQATVEGRVVDVHCSPLSCLLAFEPSFNRFTAVVQARSFDVIPPAELERRYVGKRVRVQGKIEERDGKPEIVLDSPDAIALAGAKRAQDRETDRAARSQVEVLERLADVLTRVEDLTERLADVQQRMDTLMAQLEQREAALAAAQASVPPPPPPPSYGEPQQRPAFEALRTVKRGMRRADVERLIGQPAYVENGNGWTTWYYGYGRSVSFDARGRAQALVGFPEP